MDDPTSPDSPDMPAEEPAADVAPTEVMPVIEPEPADEAADGGALDEGTEAGEGEPPEEEGKRKLLWLWIALGVVVALLLAWWAFGGTTEEEEPEAPVVETETIAVPDLVGLSEEDAAAALAEAGLDVGASEAAESVEVLPGTVLEQSPDAGTEVEANSTVDLVLAVVPIVTVPEVTALSESGAIAKLAETGLPVQDIVYEFDAQVAAGFVISQDPAAGEDVTVGTITALVVSKGAETGQVPNVVGLAQADADHALVADGFTVVLASQTNADVPAGTVSAQSPAAGTVTPAGSSVTITVSTGAPATPQASVPDVVGAEVVEAITTLNGAQLAVDFDFVPAEDSDQYLKVIAQDVAANTQVAPGSTVTISVGLPEFLFDGSLSDLMPDFVTLPSIETTE